MIKSACLIMFCFSLCMFPGSSFSGQAVAKSEHNATTGRNSVAPEQQDGFFFDVWERLGNEHQALGVYYYDVAQETLTEILSDGYSLQDLSADKQWLLVNHGRVLWRISTQDGSSEIMDEDFYDQSTGKAAMFLADGSLVSLHWAGSAVQVRLKEHGGNWIQAPLQGATLPEEIVGEDAQQRIWLRLRQCTQAIGCTAKTEVWRISTDNDVWEGKTAEEIYLPQKGTRIAYSNSSINPDLVFFATQDHAMVRDLRLAGAYPLDGRWSADGEQLALLRLVRNDTTHGIQGVRPLLVNPDLLSVSEFSALDGITARVGWLTQDKGFVIFYTKLDGDVYSLNLAAANLAQKSVELLPLQPAITGDKFLYIRQLIGGSSL
jgi:hypothetical protein